MRILASVKRENHRRNGRQPALEGHSANDPNSTSAIEAKVGVKVASGDSMEEMARGGITLSA